MRQIEPLAGLPASGTRGGANSLENRLAHLRLPTTLHLRSNEQATPAATHHDIGIQSAVRYGKRRHSSIQRGKHMNDNPYQASDTILETPELHIDIPEKVTKRILHAAVAGCISGALTLIVTLISMSGTPLMSGVGAWSLIDVVVIFGLSFGIYKKSRTCAVLMFVYFVGSKALMIVQGQNAMSGMGLGLVFAIMFGLGVSATFQYHSLMRAAKNG